MRSLLKHKMLDRGRTDFIQFLSEILDCSRQTASAKFKGSDFTESEIKILAKYFEFTGVELEGVFKS